MSGRTRILVNLLAVAVVLRLLQLGHLSLWTDEGITWWNATRGGWRETVYAEWNHPPVWWVVTRAWLTAFPGDEFALRMPAALCGALSVFLAYRLSRRLSDRARVPARGGFVGGDGTTAAWVAALAATNPFWIEQSQEARMYAALLAEALGLSLLYLRWLDRGGRGVLVAYAALASLALHTHYFAVWPIAAHAAHALWAARGARARGEALRPWPFLLAQVAAGLSFVPWFLHVASSYRGVAGSGQEPLGRLAHALWRMGTGPALVPIDAVRARATPAATFAEEPVLIVATALAWFVPIAFGAWALRRDRGSAAFVGSAVLVPLALVLAACLRWPLVHEKYLIFLAPFLLHLAVTGARAAPGFLRPALLGLLVALHAAGLLAYHFGDLPPADRWFASGHAYGKEQWRATHAYVGRMRAKGDVVLLNAPFTGTVWNFYDRASPVPYETIPPPEVRLDRALSPEQILVRYPEIADAGQVILVLSHPSTDDPEHYPVALRAACAAAWGVAPVVRDAEYEEQWGIRILRFARPKPP